MQAVEILLINPSQFHVSSLIASTRVKTHQRSSKVSQKAEFTFDCVFTAGKWLFCRWGVEGGNEVRN
jgi:hypothetical protein